jgi:hypothetical protein
VRKKSEPERQKLRQLEKKSSRNLRMRKKEEELKMTTLKI